MNLKKNTSKSMIYIVGPSLSYITSRQLVQPEGLSRCLYFINIRFCGIFFKKNGIQVNNKTLN